MEDRRRTPKNSPPEWPDTHNKHSHFTWTLPGRHIFALYGNMLLWHICKGSNAFRPLVPKHAVKSSYNYLITLNNACIFSSPRSLRVSFDQWKTVEYDTHGPSPLRFHFKVSLVTFINSMSELSELALCILICMSVCMRNYRLPNCLW